MDKLAIIGSGISGLTIANLLKNNFSITVFEKARGVGGRMSCRRTNLYSFNHGVKYFTSKNKYFENFIQDMAKHNIIKKWDAKFINIINNNKIIKNTNICNLNSYIGIPAMNSIPKYLSKNINIKLNTKISLLNKKNNKWNIIDNTNNSLGSYNWVIITAPCPQTTELIPNYIEFYKNIKSINMQSCLTLMLSYENNLDLNFDVANIKDIDIKKIYINNNIEKTNNKFSILIDTTEKWANKYNIKNKENIIKFISEKAGSIINCDLNNAVHKDIHKWSYSNLNLKTNKHVNKSKYYIDLNNNIAACGDWCINGTVESAFVSGFELANYMLNYTLYD